MNFKALQSIILEDDRVLLRPLEVADVDHLLCFSEQEPHLWKYSLLQAGGGRENLENYLKVAVEARERQIEFPYIVFDKAAKRYAGSTRFYDLNFPFLTTQLGYTWYGSDFHGTGLNQHCKFLMLQLAFETLKMKRVEFRADATNLRSIAAMKGIGCTVEGILRSNSPTANGQRRDSIVLSILQSEWESTVKNNLLLRLT